MKLTAVEKVVAEMRAELQVVGKCVDIMQAGGKLEDYSVMLVQCIARLSSNGSEPPKPPRTRRGRKAQETGL
jgi:hypothetical protein